MSAKDFIFIALGVLTILKIVFDIVKSKGANAKQDTDIAVLKAINKERFDNIKTELEKVNKKLDNHITHISADIAEINKSLINLSR